MAPVTIATSTVATAVSNPQQRAPMYINGRFWMWFSDGTNFKCSQSADGITFAATTGWVDRAATSANRFSVAYDPINSKFSYAFTKSSDSKLYWRQGVLNADGSITWDAAEQTIATLTGMVPFYPSVDYDGTGIAWVSLSVQTGSYPTVIACRVYLNTVTNGTWTTDANYPVDVHTGETAAIRSCILGFTTNGAIVLYTKAVPVVYAQELDGAGEVGGEETASDSQLNSVNTWSAAKYGDTTILQWQKTSTQNFWEAKRTSGSWSAGSQIGDAGDTLGLNCAPVASVDADTGDTYTFIPILNSATSYAYFKNRVFVADVEEPTGFYDCLTLQTSLQCYGNKLCIGWLQSGSSPRNVRFDSIDVTPPPPPSNVDFVQVM